MAYENVKLVLAGLSGEIYMARMNKSGFMGESRKIATEDCLRATTEWFMKNKKKVIHYGELPNGEKPHVFYTSDSEKANRIIQILKEDEQSEESKNANKS